PHAYEEVARDHRQDDAGRWEEHGEEGRCAEVYEDEGLKELGADDGSRRPNWLARRLQGVVEAVRGDMEDEQDDETTYLVPMRRTEAVDERGDDHDRRESPARPDRFALHSSGASSTKRPWMVKEVARASAFHASRATPQVPTF